jgi:hypothetical protein
VRNMEMTRKYVFMGSPHRLHINTAPSEGEECGGPSRLVLPYLGTIFLGHGLGGTR